MVQPLNERHQDWQTPRHLARTLVDRYTLNLDVCATTENAVCPGFITECEDGLEAEWHGRAWCNPPFKQIRKWLEKGLRERVPRVYLVPASVSTSWFHELVWGRAHVYFFTRRVAYEGRPGSSPGFASMLLTYDLEPVGFSRMTTDGEVIAD